MTKTYRVFLYSSDVDCLTFEGDFATREEADICVANWCGDRDVEEELTAGRWQIQERLNGHLRGHYEAYAHAYPLQRRSERQKKEGETSEQWTERTNQASHDRQLKSKQLLGHVPYPTKEAAAQAIRVAIDTFLRDIDPQLAGRIERANRAKGIYQKYLTDAAAFGWEIYTGESGARFKYEEDTTDEELAAIQFPEGGFGHHSVMQGFTVTSGALRVTDPCYHMEVWCAANLENVMNGEWLGSVQYYTEPRDEYSQKRFEESLKEVAGTGERSSRRLTELEKELADATDDEKAGAQAAVDMMKEWHRNMALRDFSQMMGNPDDWGGRVASLYIRHSSIYQRTPIEEMERTELHAGVDSGQAGFFDLEAFKKVAAAGDNHQSDTPEHEDFYQACCSNDLGSASWGAVQGMGVCSSTGYGDGGYPVFVKRNGEGQVVEALLVYIGDDEEEDEDEGEEE